MSSNRNRTARISSSASRPAPRCCWTAAPTSWPRPHYSGGHDVVSSTVPGQEPLVAYPGASGRLLYSLDSGVVPGVTGNPTNLGRDPYVAVRGAERLDDAATSACRPTAWRTRDRSARPLLEADRGLNQFAFGGDDICDPCFEDGSTNVPLRRSNGNLEKGMAGSIEPRRRSGRRGAQALLAPTARPSSSAPTSDSSEQGNEGSVSIYDRNLQTGATQVVSTMPNGATMTGTGIAELDVSNDGQRVLIGKHVGEDAAGNEFFDLYMHVGSSAELGPGRRLAQRRHLQRDDRRRLEGLLHHPRPAGRRHRHAATTSSSRTSAPPRRPSPGSRPAPAAPATPTPAPPISELERRLRRAGLQRRRDRRRRRGRGGRRDGLLRQPGAARRRRERRRTGQPADPNQANLYVVKPGQAPQFVATIDSSLVKPGPQPPKHPVEHGFVTALGSPESMAVDQATGDVYVVEKGGGTRRPSIHLGRRSERIHRRSRRRHQQDPGQHLRRHRPNPRSPSTTRAASSTVTSTSPAPAASKLFAGNGTLLGDINRRLLLPVRSRGRPVERRRLRRRLQLRRHLAAHADLGDDSGHGRQLHRDQRQNAGHEPLPGRRRHRRQRLRLAVVERADEKILGGRLRSSASEQSRRQCDVDVQRPDDRSGNRRPLRRRTEQNRPLQLVGEPDRDDRKQRKPRHQLTRRRGQRRQTVTSTRRTARASSSSASNRCPTTRSTTRPSSTASTTRAPTATPTSR